MTIAMWWGNSFIMSIEASSERSFMDQVYEHAVKYWSNVKYSDYEGVWDELLKSGSAGAKVFEFFRNDA